MKKFNNFKDAFKFVNDIVEKGVSDSKEAIAEQVYKDSKELTYYSDQGNTYHMYDSGELHSNFKEGIIIERAPYVRRRYYEGGVARGKHKKAQPRWFDKTVAKHKKEYLNMLAQKLISAKKEV